MLHLFILFFFLKQKSTLIVYVISTKQVPKSTKKYQTSTKQVPNKYQKVPNKYQTSTKQVPNKYKIYNNFYHGCIWNTNSR